MAVLKHMAALRCMAVLKHMAALRCLASAGIPWGDGLIHPALALWRCALGVLTMAVTEGSDGMPHQGIKAHR